MWGAPLEPGERVLYYYRVDQTTQYAVEIFFGVLTAPIFGLGIVLLIYLLVHHRERTVYAQAVTTRRLVTLNGKGAALWSIRWEEVAGLNKNTTNGHPTAFGVRNRTGAQFMFTEDLSYVERAIQRFLETPPAARAQIPEVHFDPSVK
jgi:hypothetical protein